MNSALQRCSETYDGENMQRVGFLSVVPTLLASFGVKSSAVLKSAGLTAGALDDPEAFIPYSAGGRLLKLAANATDCPHFGLLIGERMGLASLGLVGALASKAPTLGAAVRDFSANQHRNAQGGVAYLVTSGDLAFLGYAVYQPQVEGNSIMYDMAASLGLNVVRELTNMSRLPEIQIWLSRSEPHDLEPYRERFGVIPQFNCEQTAIVLPRKWLDRPLPGADPAARKALQAQMDATPFADRPDDLARLRRVLRIGLLKGGISGTEIAREMGINRRTLHRRLRDKGVGFQEILDEVRCEFAQQLLANTALPIGEIASTVRYSDPGVFTRAFVRWSGVTPSLWRSEHQEQSAWTV